MPSVNLFLLLFSTVNNQIVKRALRWLFYTLYNLTIQVQHISIYYQLKLKILQGQILIQNNIFYLLINIDSLPKIAYYTTKSNHYYVITQDAYNFEQTHYYLPIIILSMHTLTHMRLILILLLCTTVVSEEPCKCLNGGTCSVQRHCICPINFIGQQCEIYAHPLKQQPIHASLTANFSYFYFQPNQVNYYRLTFNICMLHNPSLIPSIFYIQTERNNGSLRAVQSLFETAKLELGEKGCTSFSTHYISIKRRQDHSYRKIVVGLRALSKDDPAYYLNVYRSSQSEDSTQNSIDKKQIDFPPELIYQRITVQMKYQTYIQNNYYGNFIIISTASLLLLVFSAFINYLRKRYRLELQERLSQTQLQDFSRLRYHRRNNPEREERIRKNQFECIEVFMPTTRYGEKSCFFVADLLTNCQQHLQIVGEVDCCSICLNDFQKEDQIRTTPCKHRYHRECIDNWCTSNLSCPICRHPLDFRKEIRQIYFKFLRGELIH